MTLGINLCSHERMNTHSDMTYKTENKCNPEPDHNLQRVSLNPVLCVVHIHQGCHPRSFKDRRLFPVDCSHQVGHVRDETSCFTDTDILKEMTSTHVHAM